MTTHTNKPLLIKATKSLLDVAATSMIYRAEFSQKLTKEGSKLLPALGG